MNSMRTGLVAACMTAVASALSPDGKCRVLAMRGGGVHGAFEVGVLKAFVEKLDPIDVHYDIISGVSVGALNTSIFMLHDFGEEKAAVDELLELYQNNLPQDYWDFWPTYVIEPFWKQSAVDPTNL